MQHTQQQTKRSESSKRPPRARSKAPTSGGDPPPSQGDGAEVEVCYGDLFGTPALDDPEGQERTGEIPQSEKRTGADVWGDPEAEPVPIPPLRFTAFPPERVLYAAAFRAAYKYPDALMLVMSGVRKGLERGKKAAESRGESR